jgi:hypothetical protein
MADFDFQFQWPILATDPKPLKSATCPILAVREFSIQIRSAANMQIKNLEIVNINTNHINFI